MPEKESVKLLFQAGTFAAYLISVGVHLIPSYHYIVTSQLQFLIIGFVSCLRLSFLLRVLTASLLTILWQEDLVPGSHSSAIVSCRGNQSLPWFPPY